MGAGDRCARLKDHVRERTRNYTKLVLSVPADGVERARDWRLLVNVDIEVEA